MTKIKELFGSFFDDKHSKTYRNQVSSVLHKLVGIEQNLIDDMLRRLVYIESVQQGEATEEIVKLAQKKQTLAEAHKRLEALDTSQYTDKEHALKLLHEEKEFEDLLSTLDSLLTKIRRWYDDKSHKPEVKELLNTLDNVLEEMKHIADEERKAA